MRDRRKGKEARGRREDEVRKKAHKNKRDRRTEKRGVQRWGGRRNGDGEGKKKEKREDEKERKRNKARGN